MLLNLDGSQQARLAQVCVAGKACFKAPMLLIGAAPNAIAYNSKQFTTQEFFIYGLLASIILMGVLAFAVYFLWPLMGMPVKL